MANIRFNASRKTTIILLFVLFLIVGGTGGYLLWRVNQQKTVAPTDSEAACAVYSPGGGGTSYPTNCGCPSGNSMDGEIYGCPYCEGVTYCGTNATAGGCSGYDCGRYCFNLNCGKSACDQVIKDEQPKCGDGSVNQSSEQCDPPGGACTLDGKAGTCSSTCTCTVNPYCGDGVKNNNEQCDPAGSACTTTDGKAGTCSSSCTCTANPYCGDGVKNNNEQCDGVGTVCTTPDGHAGKCSSTCTCTANPYCGDGVKNNNEQCDPAGSACTTTEGRAGVCSSSCTCTANPYCGDGKLNSGEKCEKGDPTGVSCTWDKCNQQACACLPAELVTQKVGAEQCINEGTANVSSTVTYTISIKNNGKGDGKITKIEDTLDDKVVSGNLTPKEISDGGIYSSGKIVWTFRTPLIVEAGKEKLLTYKLDIDKGNFGTYGNSVVIFPETGPASQPITAQVTVDCKANEPVSGTVPETGIFDDSRNIVVMGAILLFVGLGWSWITSTYHKVSLQLSTHNKQKFERKVVKK